MKLITRVLITSVLCTSAACGGKSPTEPAAPVVPVVAPVVLTGNWTGTVDGFPMAVLLQHVDSKLSGSLTIPPNYGVFDLTQTASSGATLTFTGTFKVNGADSACPQTGRPGSMTVDTATNSMTGSFTGVNTACKTETNAFALKKQ